MQLQALASFHPSLSAFFLQRVDDQKSMRYQKTLLSFDVNVYTAQSTLTYHITQRNKKSVVCCGALQSRWQQTSFSRSLRLSDYVMRNAAAAKVAGCNASKRCCNKSQNTRENDHGNARQTSAYRFQ
jgi:hypothetical protein